MAFSPSYVNGDFLHDVLTGAALPLWSANTHRVALYTNAITGQNGNNMERYNNGPYASNQVAASGDYIAGGKALTTPVLAVPTAGKIIFTDNGSPTCVWTGVTWLGAAAPRGMALYNDSLTTPNADPIIAAINFNAAIEVDAGTFTITWDTLNGIFYHQFA